MKKSCANKTYLYVGRFDLAAFRQLVHGLLKLDRFDRQLLQELRTVLRLLVILAQLTTTNQDHVI